MKPAPCVTVVTALIAASPARAGAESRPIVAVFAINASARVVPPDQRAALTDFLAARLAASGRFRTVPREQIKQRLGQLRKESYRDCYDQACQIEIGRELAASKALSTRVIAVGDACQMTFELYDLESAASEAAHTASGACAAAGLFSTISAAVDALVRKAPAPAAPAPAVRAPAADEDRVSLHVGSEPAGALVLVDGLQRGKTPLDLPVPRGKRLRLTLRHEGYEPAQRTVVADDAIDLQVPMKLTEAGRYELAATSEWLGIGLGWGHAWSAGDGVAVDVRMANFKGRHFFWTLIAFQVLVVVREDAIAGDSTSGAGSVTIGSRAGYPLYLGGRGQHQLLFGLGVGWGSVFVRTPGTSSDRSLFVLSPGIDYTYNAYDGLVPFGIGVRTALPAAGDLEGTYPATFMLTANIGISLYRLVKRSVR